MSNKDLRRQPHTSTDKNWWWYEEAKGLTIVHDPANDNTGTFLIPWKSIRAALVRKDK